MMTLTSGAGYLVLLVDCLIKTGVLGTAEYSSSSVHTCLLLLGAMLMSIESESMSYLWFLFVYKTSFYSITTNSQHIADVCDRIRGPSKKKRVIKAAIISFEIIIISLIGNQNEWATMTWETFFVYFTALSVAYSSVRLFLEFLSALHLMSN
jgi:hypothetical protein